MSIILVVSRHHISAEESAKTRLQRRTCNDECYVKQSTQSRNDVHDSPFLPRGAITLSARSTIP